MSSRKSRNDRPSVSSRRSTNSAQSITSTITGGYGGGSGLFICQYSHLEDDYRFEGTKAEVDSVLSKIEKAGVDVGKGKGCSSCLGLLDPATNVHINTLIGSLQPQSADGGVRGDPMSHRSLDGLIAFLTSLFPYLPDAEALTYIDAAAADPLVAALLVIHRREPELTIESFSTAASLEIALRSAAVAAKHPNLERFIHGWKVASRMPERLATQLLRANKYLIPETVAHFLDRYSNDLQLEPEASLQLEPEVSWELAKARLMHVTDRALLKGGGRLPSARGYMKRMLLSVIHGYYLKALAALPKEELTERFHRSLLIAGHCYGPLDPVSNIIVNTIWYEQSFPPVIKVELKAMISTDCLWRIAARSLYGLVSFLCNRVRNLTPDQALHHLLVAQANLRKADPLELSDHGGKKTGRATVLGAYVAAGQSARHPRPHSQAEFLGEEKSVGNLHTFQDRLLPTVHDGCTLTKEIFDCLLTLFRSPSSVGMAYPQREPLDPKPIRQEAYERHCTAKHSFWLKDDRVRRKVEAALHSFNKPGEPKYSLHLICGVNEFVGREFSLDPEVKTYNPRGPFKYHYSHINFLATCEGETAPKLFFAECSNHGTDTCWCVPIPLHPDAGIFLKAARCVYCEHELGRIWHPITKMFYGRDHFDNLDGNYYSNDNIVGNGHKTDWIHSVLDDAIYSNVCDSGHRGPTIMNGIAYWL